MKYLFLFALLSLISVSGYSQLNRCYTYDAAGNRIAKSLCTARIEVVAEDEAAHIQLENRISSEPKVSVYPNPSTGLISIRVSGFSSETIWSLTNITGTAVLKDQALINSDHDLSYLPPGTYYIRWIDGQKPEVVSIIIVND